MLIACLSIPHSLIASCKSSVLMAETTGQATSQKTNNKIFVICYFSMWLPRWLSGKKNLPANAGDTGDSGSVPGSGRAPWEEYGKPRQYSCLENPADKGAWWATPLWAIVHKVTESQTWLSNWACTWKSREILTQFLTSLFYIFMYIHKYCILCDPFHHW